MYKLYVMYNWRVRQWKDIIVVIKDRVEQKENRQKKKKARRRNMYKGMVNACDGGGIAQRQHCIPLKCNKKDKGKS